jgi:hypothetical protein
VSDTTEYFRAASADLIKVALHPTRYPRILGLLKGNNGGAA